MSIKSVGRHEDGSPILISAAGPAGAQGLTGEQIEYTRTQTELYFGQKKIGVGTLYLTTKCGLLAGVCSFFVRNVIWLSSDDTKISRDPENFPKPCIYCSLDVELVPEARFVPPDPNELLKLYGTFCTCADMNPDYEDGDYGAEGELGTREQALLSRLDSLLTAPWDGNEDGRYDNAEEDESGGGNSDNSRSRTAGADDDDDVSMSTTSNGADKGDRKHSASSKVGFDASMADMDETLDGGEGDQDEDENDDADEDDSAFTVLSSAPNLSFPSVSSSVSTSASASPSSHASNGRSVPNSGSDSKSNGSSSTIAQATVGKKNKKRRRANKDKRKKLKTTDDADTSTASAATGGANGSGAAKSS